MESDSEDRGTDAEEMRPIERTPPTSDCEQGTPAVVVTAAEASSSSPVVDLEDDGGEESDDADDLGLVLPYLGSKSADLTSVLLANVPNSNHDSLSTSNHTALSASSTSVTGGDLVFSDTETSPNPDLSCATLDRSHRPMGTPGSPSIMAEAAGEFLEDSAHATALNFAMEHRVFLRSALMLLAERDKQAPELGMMDPIVMKAGPLKKAAHLMNGVWKAKYVEIRRGMFSYYENAVSKDEKTGERELLRKNIPLTASCTCRPVKLHQKALNFTALGAIFELSSNGNKRLWMANSREERHRWMHAIQHAMVGGSVTRGAEDFGGSRGSSTAWKDDSRLYLKAQSTLRSTKAASDYINGLREMLKNSLQVPVKWVRTKQSGDASAVPNFQEDSIDMSVDQLWRDLQRDSVRIDGELSEGSTGHGPERIAGALMRRILHVSRSSAVRSLSESQALAYARDALLAGNRTRTGGDSYFCVNALCRNDDLVVVVPSGREAEPTRFEVSEDESDHSFHSRLDSKNGWIKTRNLLNRTWKRRYFVLCEGTLSYYEGAHPRPHGLKGQMFLKDAVFSLRKRNDEDQFVLSITVNEGSAPLRETLLLFESTGYMRWNALPNPKSMTIRKE